MEKKNYEITEEYYTLDFYEKINRKEKSPYSLIMDISDVIPGEIEIEDEIKEYTLWRKFSKISK
ncbi:MAG TPA: hypothetical protein VGB37_18100 [Candidatus Lokiarchaeia archaeon]